MSSSYSSEVLLEKLSKLNSSQQSIQSLSSWCITHRKKAKHIVATWEDLFNSSSDGKRVSFLFLANDILQNSRRKGSEFVHEFWKVLPGALKSVHGSSGDHGKKVVLRLVSIWDERKVFGSRSHGLKDDILCSRPPQPVDNDGKTSTSVDVMRKDGQTINHKLRIGGMPEKLATTYHCVLNEHFSENSAINKCKAAVHLVGKMKKEFDDACSHGNLQGLPSIEELQEQEATMKQCLDQFGSVEAAREALVVQLKEELEEQETKLDLIRHQLQVAQTETERASNLRQRLISAIATRPTVISSSPVATSLHMQTIISTEPSVPLQSSSDLLLLQPLLTSFANSSTSSEEQDKKAAAAAMADKLASSTSSALMLTSVLSSLVAEEAASMNATLNTAAITSSPPMCPPEKRPRLENPISSSNLEDTYFGNFQQQLVSVPLTMPQISVSSMMQYSAEFALPSLPTLPPSGPVGPSQSL